MDHSMHLQDWQRIFSKFWKGSFPITPVWLEESSNSPLWKNSQEQWLRNGRRWGEFVPLFFTVQCAQHGNLGSENSCNRLLQIWTILVLYLVPEIQPNFPVEESCNIRGWWYERTLYWEAASDPMYPQVGVWLWWLEGTCLHVILIDKAASANQCCTIEMHGHALQRRRVQFFNYTTTNSTAGDHKESTLWHSTAKHSGAKMPSCG